MKRGDKYKKGNITYTYGYNSKDDVTTWHYLSRCGETIAVGDKVFKEQFRKVSDGSGHTDDADQAMA